jgi:hypothetical protein
VAEKIAFNTHHFARLLGFLLGVDPDTVPYTEGNNMEIGRLTASDVGKFLTYPGLWAGLGVSAVLLAITIRVRRSRDPI